jgi:hypothetical protein
VERLYLRLYAVLGLASLECIQLASIGRDFGNMTSPNSAPCLPNPIASQGLKSQLEIFPKACDKLLVWNLPCRHRV